MSPANRQGPVIRKTQGKDSRAKQVMTENGRCVIYALSLASWKSYCLDESAWSVAEKVRSWRRERPGGTLMTAFEDLRRRCRATAQLRSSTYF